MQSYYDGTRVQPVGATTPLTTVFLGVVEITLSPTGRITRTYYFVHGQRSTLREQRSDGIVIYFLHSEQLSSASLATTVTGTLLSQRRYLPYGETRPDFAASAMPTDRRCTGQREEVTLA